MPHTTPLPCLSIASSLPGLAGFASLLQHGILVAVDRAIPAQHFLLSLPGFTSDYIEHVVQTVFINGVAADSLDCNLPAGSTVALSAAMPGLAGAIFRRQGPHGSLRSRPVAPASASGTDHGGFITLKMFNTIASDRVFDMLTHGVTMHGRAVEKFALLRADLFQPPTVLTLDGRKISCEQLLGRLSETPLLQIRASVATARD